MEKTVITLAGYKFVPLSDLRTLRARLRAFCKSWELKGTILLTTEGIHLFVAGTADKTSSLLAELRNWPGLMDFQVKISEAEHQPFTKMLVRIKKEILAFDGAGIDPAQPASPKLTAKELKQWLDEDRPVTLLDTRNNYEVKRGTFKNARGIGIDHFRDFPVAVHRLPAALKEQPIVIFCTGGIRSEKAGPFMEREGFKHIVQLDGGILKYFEECGGAHYDGECFVFNQRAGVDPSLHETEATQCFQCQTPLNETEQQDERYDPGRFCPYCFKTPAEQLTLTITKRQAAIHRAVTPLPGRQPYDRFRSLSIPEKCDRMTLLDVLGRIISHVPRAEWELECGRGLLLNADYQPVSGGHIVRAGERYRHKFPDTVEPDVNGEVQILHEDEALIVLNKPAPLPMHEGGRFHRNTLQHILNEVYHPQRPYPAHRLDANTTGLVLVTRTLHFAGRLQPQFARGEVEKLYLVRVQGQPGTDAFRCAAPISAESGELGSRTVDHAAGRAARTEFRVLHRCADDTTLLEARPLTGRTNQIRVHLWHLGFPVCGDTAYLPGQQLGSTQTLALSNAPLCLHAWRIRFRHPLTKQPIEFTAPPPVWAA